MNEIFLIDFEGGGDLLSVGCSFHFFQLLLLLIVVRWSFHLIVFQRTVRG